MGPRSGFVFSLNIKWVCVLSCFSHKHSQPHPSPQESGWRVLLDHVRKRSAHSLAGAPVAGGAGRGCTPAPAPDSGCEEAKPVAAESSMSASEVTKTHKKTRAFREDGGRDCLLPPHPRGGRRKAALPRASPWRPGGHGSLTRLSSGFQNALGGLVSGALWKVREGPHLPAPAPTGTA